MRKFHSDPLNRLGVVKTSFLVMALLIAIMTMTACQGTATVPSLPKSHYMSGPIFNRITTSSKSFSIDCVPTSVIVTANITDPFGIKRVVLHSRVGTEGAYIMTELKGTGDEYRATVKAVDMPGRGYGIWEFYITAEDLAGHQSQSPLDKSVEMLMCVSS